MFIHLLISPLLSSRFTYSSYFYENQIEEIIKCFTIDIILVNRNKMENQRQIHTERTKPTKMMNK